MPAAPHSSAEDAGPLTAVARLAAGWRGSALVTLGVGVTVGCWVAYALLYPFSGFPIPQYSMAVALALGWYVDYFARSMADRLAILVGAAVVAYLLAYVAFTLPALAGWYTEPLVRRSLYLQGLKRTFLFTAPAVVLLVVGTLGTYVVRRTYDEVTR